jgi:hypothetical protein
MKTTKNLEILIVGDRGAQKKCQRSSRGCEDSVRTAVFVCRFQFRTKKENVFDLKLMNQNKQGFYICKTIVKCDLLV